MIRIVAHFGRDGAQKSYSQTEGEKVLVTQKTGAADGRAWDGERAYAGAGGAAQRGRAVAGCRGWQVIVVQRACRYQSVTEGWTVDPWGKIDRDFIYGIGVSNMKAGDAAYLCGGQNADQGGGAAQGGCDPDVRGGGIAGALGTKALMDQGLRADYFVNSEPTDLAAMTMHAAAFTFIIDSTGRRGGICPSARRRWMRSWRRSI
jgi:acetylornithine deacetylase